ncbi:MAG: hypothetical protein K0Q79_3031, partial [Flavipsychrobacter sp.]|nr:hypothetical protein [Flavipsychrobacter sp.]
GSLVTADKEVMLHITNMLGQAVYAMPLEVKGNEVNGMVQLPYDVPNGMYLVTLRTTTGTKTFHLVIEK